MASSSIALTLTYPSSSTTFRRTSPPSLFTISSGRSFRSSNPIPSIKAATFDFPGSFIEEEGFGGDDDAPPSLFGPDLLGVEEKEEPECPPGLRQYETMTVLRPDMSEDERISLTQQYEELLVTGGGMYVEVFNRGVIPLSYVIKKKNRAGETVTFLDGIYLLFTYFTKPESMEELEQTLQADDNVIRSSSFKIKKRKFN